MRLARYTSVRCLFALACTAWLAASRAHAQDDGLLRYQPPDVEYIYPEEGEIVSPAAPPADPPAEPAPTEPAQPTIVSPTSAAPPPAPEPVSYGAQARVRAPVSAGTYQVPLENARDLPGAFGDPLRILDALPGAVPIANAVPYVYLRGAPPAAVNYAYDYIQLPLLFHAVFLRSVIHPRMLGPLSLQAGVPNAAFGRRAGGLVLAPPAAQQHKLSGELELGLLDVSAFVETPVGKGTVSVGGHIGYPRLALSIAEAMGVISPGTSFNYWDGQLRYTVPVGKRQRFELVWLGSYDNAHLPGISNDPRAGASKIEFQRVESRFIHRLPRGEFGTALRFGYDHSELGSAIRVRSIQFGPRFWSALRFGAHSLRIGGDLYASAGNVEDGPGTLATPPEGEIQISLPLYSEAPARNQGGLFAQATLHVNERTRLELGARFDYWSTNNRIDLAVDPRVRLTYSPQRKLQLHAAFGTAHQPAVFMLPLPGLTEVAVSRGLTRAIQSEVGFGYDLPWALRLEVQGYLHHYDGLLLPELVIDGIVPDNPPLVSANAYGVEFFLKRTLNKSLTGWISYTLGFAEADSGPALIGKFKPDFDVRHVVNTVMQWRVWRGLELGGRFSARSGRLIEQLNPSYAQRLPYFVRTDVRIGYRWQGRFANMLAYFEWLNMLVRKEYLDADCLLGKCIASAVTPISIPNVGVRAEF